MVPICPTAKQSVGNFAVFIFPETGFSQKVQVQVKKLFIKRKDLFAEQKRKGLETAGAPMEGSNTWHREVWVSYPQGS